jgi:hypothetical protein
MDPTIYYHEHTGPPPLYPEPVQSSPFPVTLFFNINIIISLFEFLTFPSVLHIWYV